MILNILMLLCVINYFVTLSYGFIAFIDPESVPEDESYLNNKINNVQTEILSL